MSFLCNNAAAFAVAIMASVTVWVFGGMRGDIQTYYVPWLLVLMLEVLVCFPQRHKNETSFAARERAWHAMKKDPALWTALGFFLLLLIPFLNNGLCPSCDANLIAQGFDPAPPVRFLPFCVSRIGHMHVVEWFAIALVSMLVVRHCLVRRGKRLVLQLIVWNGVAVAALGFIQGALSAPGPLWYSWKNVSPWPVPFFATFGYENTAGDYFTSLFGVAVALWRDHREQLREERKSQDMSSLASKNYGMFWKRNYFLIPAVIFYFAALNTLSRSAIILATVTAVIYFAHTLITLLSRMKMARRVTVGVWSLVVFSVIMFFSIMYMPENIQREVNTLDTTRMLDRVTGKGDYHARVATELWKDHVLFGCGGWGYRHLCTSKMTPEELKRIQTVGGINVHNDYLQFLAEHGAVGFGALVAIVVVLLWPIVAGWKVLVKEFSFKKGNDRPPRPIRIFALPAPVFFILVVATATFIHGFYDCPFRSAAVLQLFFVELAALPGFMPKMNEHARH